MLVRACLQRRVFGAGFGEWVHGLQVCHVLEFQDQLSCRLNNDLFMDEQGRNRDDFQFQFQFFGFNTKHDGKSVPYGWSKALLIRQI